MVAQPMQVNAALQALLNPTAQASSSHSAVTYDLGVPVSDDHSSQSVGSNKCAGGLAAPFPDSTDDATMESGTDKRSRESPDSTLKPEGKSLKTSEKAATPANQNSEEVPTAAAQRVPNTNSDLHRERGRTRGRGAAGAKGRESGGRCFWVCGRAPWCWTWTEKAEGARQGRGGGQGRATGPTGRASGCCCNSVKT